MQEARPSAGDTITGVAITMGRIEGTLMSRGIADRFLQFYNLILLQSSKKTVLGADKNSPKDEIS